MVSRATRRYLICCHDCIPHHNYLPHLLRLRDHEAQGGWRVLADEVAVEVLKRQQIGWEDSYRAQPGVKNDLKRQFTD